MFLLVRVNTTRSNHAIPPKPLVSPLLRCIARHRLGTVPVGEALIVITVPPPHWKGVPVGCKYLLEQIKLKVPTYGRMYTKVAGPVEDESFFFNTCG